MKRFIRNTIISRIHRFRDTARRFIGCMLYDKDKPADFDLKKTQHILFVRNDAKLGDSIVSSGVIKKLRKYRPDIKITVMTTPAMTSLFKEGFGVDEVIHLSKRPSYGEIRKVCEEVGEVDVVVALNGDMKMKDIYLLSHLRSKINIGLDSRIKLVNKNISPFITGIHYAGKFDYIATLIGIDAPPENYIVPLAPASLETVDLFLQANLVSDYVLFNPFGSGSSRKLNKETIQKFLNAIHEKEPNRQVVMLSAPDTRDELNRMAICDGKLVVHFDRSESIYDAIAAVERASSVITVDTSIVHIATGLNKQQIAIYKNEEENYQNWGPNSDLAMSLFSEKENINSIDVVVI